MNKTLSIAVVCSNPITMYFPLYECLLSALRVADEVILVNGDRCLGGEVTYVTETLKNDFPVLTDNKLIELHVPWQDRMKKNTWWLMKSIAISQATGDYVIRLDADEVLNETDYEKIIKLIELGYDAYTFRTLHFWGNYHSIIQGKNLVDNGNNWYKRRPYMFLNNKGVYENLYDLVDVDGNPLDCKHTSIEVFHYGHVRPEDVYLEKKNKLEKAYHDNWVDLDRWEWEHSDTVHYSGSHPSVMTERIKLYEKVK